MLYSQNIIHMAIIPNIIESLPSGIPILHVPANSILSQDNNILIELQNSGHDIIKVHYEKGPLTLSKMLVINNPDKVKEVFAKTKQNGEYILGPTGLFKMASYTILGRKNVLVLSNQEHITHRQLIEIGINGEMIKKVYTQIMIEEANKTVEAIKSSEGVIDMSALLTKLTLVIVTKALLGNISEQQIETSVQAFNGIEEAMQKQFNSQIDLGVFGNMKKINKIIKELISDARKKPEAENNNLLYHLIHAKDESGKHMLSKGAIRDEAMILFFAGHETTAKLLYWIFYSLFSEQGQEAYTDLMMEIDKIDTELNLNPSLQLYDLLMRSTVFRGVVNEGLRMYPPGDIFKSVIRDFEIDGQLITKGYDVAFSPYAIHHNEKYFPDPEKFDHKRWVDARANYQTFFPFSFGNHDCVGSGLAQVEARVILYILLKNINFKLENIAPINPVRKVVLQPDAPLIFGTTTRR